MVQLIGKGTLLPTKNTGPADTPISTRCQAREFLSLGQASAAHLVHRLAESGAWLLAVIATRATPFSCKGRHYTLGTLVMCLFNAKAGKPFLVEAGLGRNLT